MNLSKTCKLASYACAVLLASACASAADPVTPSSSNAANMTSPSDDPSTDPDIVQRLAAVHQEPSQVELRFVDASVPPEYHRSYTIIAAADSASVKVDVYGTVIASDSTKPSAEAWRTIVEAATRLPETQSADDADVSGQSSHELTLSYPTGKLRSFTWTSRSDTPTPAIEQALALTKRIEALFPNLEQLEQTPYPKQ